MGRLSKFVDITIITIIGTALRIIYIRRDEMWFDEAFTGVLMRIPSAEFFKTLVFDAHPPLYNLMSKVWSSAFGTSELALRALPLAFGISTIVLVYITAKKLFDSHTATLSALLIAINPYLIGYSNEARSYSFYGFITLLTFYFLVAKNFPLFVTGLVVMGLTHYISLLFAAVMMAYYLYKHIERGEWVRSIIKLSALAATFALIVNYALKVSRMSLNMAWVRPSTIMNIPRSLTSYLYGVQTKLTGGDAINSVKLLFFDEFILGGIFLILLLAGAGMTIYKTRQNKRELEKVVLLLSLVVAPQILLILAGSVLGDSIYVERYLTPAAIFFIFLVAYTLSGLPNFELIAVIVAVYAFSLTKIQTPNYSYGMRELARSYKNSQSEIIFTTPIDYLVGRYYFGETARNIRLLDPNKEFAHWPLLKDDRDPKNTDGALIVAPDWSKAPSNFKPYAEIGSYKILSKTE
ncbi:glycosyltransferase family 39 protein [candidate division WWE3 bacterium]|nr:glycosyltransferase family 39 protein [candidate division WWE3 bacterium]